MRTTAATNLMFSVPCIGHSRSFETTGYCNIQGCKLEIKGWHFHTDKVTFFLWEETLDTIVHVGVNRICKFTSQIYWCVLIQLTADC